MYKAIYKPRAPEEQRKTYSDQREYDKRIPALLKQQQYM